MLAQEEARLLDHDYLGTEHLLLGLIRQGDSVAATVLGQSGATLEMARAEVERIIGRGGSAPHGHIAFTPRAKEVLEVALREATQLGDEGVRRHRRGRRKGIGPEHILLGLIREGGGVAVEVFDHLGVDLAGIRRGVLDAMGQVRLVGETSGPLRRYGVQGRTLRTGEPIVRCPGCDFEVSLSGAPHELRIRIERSGDNPGFRIYLTVGDVGEQVVHECEPEASGSMRLDA